MPPLHLPLRYLILTALLPLAAVAQFKSLAVGATPESVTRGFDGKLFVTLMGTSRQPGDGDGGIVRVDGDQVTPFATGLDDPKGIVFAGGHLITADFTKVWKFDAQGQRTLLAGPEAFPQPPVYLNDVALAPDGKSILVTDMGAAAKMRGPDGKLWPLDSAEAKALPVIGRVYRITLDGKVSVAVETNAAMPCPNGVSEPAPGVTLVAEFFTGKLLEFSAGVAPKVLAEGHRSADGIERGRDGTPYVSEVFSGKVWAIARDGKEASLDGGQLQSAADFLLDEEAGHLIVPDSKAGKLVWVPLRK